MKPICPNCFGEVDPDDCAEWQGKPIHHDCYWHVRPPRP